MAQYKGGEERRKFEDLDQERNERLSDSDYGRESRQKPQEDGYRGEPQNVADTTKEGLSGANAGTPVEEGRGYGKVDTNARPTKGSFGPLNNGDEKFPSDTGSNGFGDEGVNPGKAREYEENGDRKQSGYDRNSAGETGYQVSEESLAEEKNGRKHPVGIEGLNETSPYTQHDSTDDYNKRGYGGDGYTKNVDSDDLPESYGAEGPTIAGPEVGQAQKYGSEERAKKHDVKETHVPRHEEEADQREDNPKQMEGCMGKIKEKLTGKPRDTNAPTSYDPVYPGDEPHKKKGVIEKIKDKLSPST